MKPSSALNFGEISELVCRIYVFIFLNIYGFGKIMGGQFYSPDRIPAEIASTPLSQVGSFELAWTFMGHSYAYILFVGISQIIGAWLLLFRSTKLIGVFILLPILVNIIVFDIIFLDAYGALGSAVIYFTMLLIILSFNWDKMREIIRVLTSFPSRQELIPKQNVYRLLITAGIILIVFFADQVIVNLLGHGKG